MSPNQSVKPKPASTSPNINVTPLIDVLLVLLIIFMVIAPHREAQLPVRAPETSSPDTPPANGMLMLTVSGELQLALNTRPLTREDLPSVMKNLMEQRDPEARVLFIKAPSPLPYEAVVSLIDITKGAGVMTVGLLAD